MSSSLYFVSCVSWLGIFYMNPAEGGWTVLKNYDLSNMDQIRRDWNLKEWWPATVNRELQAYTNSPENVYTENGMLVIKAIKKVNPCHTESGRDIQGNNMYPVHGQPLSACCNLCRQASGCKGYAWNDYKGGTCWLKSGLGPVISKNGVSLGVLFDITSGRLESKQTFSPVNSPGRKLRVEYVAQVPTVMGAWPALWMLGKSEVYGGWPQEGEIDVMEWVWQQQNQFLSSLHWKGATDWSTPFNQLSMGQLQSQFTTFGVEYSAVANEEYIQFYMKTAGGDTHYGNRATPSTWLSTFNPNPPCGNYVPGASRCSPLAPFDNEMYLILNFAVGGEWGGCCGVTNYNAFENSGVLFKIKSVTVYQNS